MSVTRGTSTDLASLVARSTDRAVRVVGSARYAVRRAAEVREQVRRDRERRLETARRRRERHPRNRLVAANLGLAERIAGQYSGRGQPRHDLRQVAYLGLVKAAGRYDAARGVPFEAYAQTVVRGEVRRYFRDYAWTLRVARPVQETYLAVRAAREELSHRLQRPPTPTELAAAVGATEDEVIEALDAGESLHLDSLDAPAKAGDSRPRHEAVAVDPGYALAEDRTWLAPALATLPERERKILFLRFFEGLSQSEIAPRVGISQMHVSRLLARALARLREAAGAGDYGIWVAPSPSRDTRSSTGSRAATPDGGDQPTSIR